MTARVFTARMKIDYTALQALDQDKRSNLLDADVRAHHPEAQRVDDVEVVAEHGNRYLVARYVFLHTPPTIVTNVAR